MYRVHAEIEVYPLSRVAIYGQLQGEYRVHAEKDSILLCQKKCSGTKSMESLLISCA